MNRDKLRVSGERGIRMGGWSQGVVLEGKKWLKNPLYLFFLVLPLFIMVLFAVVWPLAERLVASRWGFDLQPYRSWLGLAMLYMIPQLLGMPLGFRLLEEKDQGTLGVFLVLPRGAGWYVGMLLLGLAGLSVLFVLGLMPLILAPHLRGWSWGVHGLAAGMAGLETCIFAMCISALARDKVEGMTVGKGLSLVTMLPLLVFLVPGRFSGIDVVWLAGLTPWFWPAALLLLDLPGPEWIWWVTGFGVHGIWLGGLLRRELNRIGRGL
ncbi:hypothetical protein [Spirochaeta lutea]|uniref:Uncharacterized protein n=1 Tax=Spirochaeta lutea TaxID=1480694 RepID=A0A098QTA8_9SPIO|nr:hypothetical protein [Spirochaeta lutea]KGE70939.1 hypothetical protein DC28_13430 [Spirochaeta lutea]